MIPLSNGSGRGRRQGKGVSSGGSGSLIKWVRTGLIILGACRAIFGESTQPGISPAEEKERLKKEALQLKKRLAAIENRIAELEGEPALKAIGREGNVKEETPAEGNNEKIEKTIQS